MTLSINTFDRSKVRSFGVETRPKPGEPFVLVFRSEFWIALQDRSMAVASAPLVAAPLAERPPSELTGTMIVNRSERSRNAFWP